MTMHGFSPETMTDQELLDKITQLQARLAVANRYSSGAGDQLQQMIQLCSTTLTERFERKMFEARFGTSEGGEKSITLTDEVEAEKKKDIGGNTPVRVESPLRLRRSSRPVSKE